LKSDGKGLEKCQQRHPSAESAKRAESGGGSEKVKPVFGGPLKRKQGVEKGRSQARGQQRRLSLGEVV